VDIFHPGLFSVEDKIAAAETFLDGGTDYETPLRAAIALMEGEGFENADVVFITDGYCELPENFRNELTQKQAELAFHITGVLLDTDIGAGDFSLKHFCQAIHRTSETFRDDIARSLINQRE
jgi:hypothetical protein